MNTFETVAYHGTNANFSEFKIIPKEDGFNSFGEGVYFTDSQEKASNYGTNTIKVNILFDNIFDIDENLETYNELCESDNFTQELVAQGYDGVKLNKDWQNIYVVFNTNQINILSRNKL